LTQSVLLISQIEITEYVPKEPKEKGNTDHNDHKSECFYKKRDLNDLRNVCSVFGGYTFVVFLILNCYLKLLIIDRFDFFHKMARVDQLQATEYSYDLD
jgi:hypothetical protein